MGAILLHNSFCVSFFENLIFKVKDIITYTLNMLPTDVSKSLPPVEHHLLAISGTNLAIVVKKKRL
jgi:hypothetical protein